MRNSGPYREFVQGSSISVARFHIGGEQRRATLGHKPRRSLPHHGYLCRAFPSYARCRVIATSAAGHIAIIVTGDPSLFSRCVSRRHRRARDCQHQSRLVCAYWQRRLPGNAIPAVNSDRPRRNGKNLRRSAHLGRAKSAALSSETTTRSASTAVESCPGSTGRAVDPRDFFEHPERTRGSTSSPPSALDAIRCKPTRTASATWSENGSSTPHLSHISNYRLDLPDTL